MTTATITPVELSFDETVQARTVFNSVCDDYARSEHNLRQVLSKMGMYPPDDQIQIVFQHYLGKVSFQEFAVYLKFLKGLSRQPEPRDGDTLRAFSALGGGDQVEGARGGCVNADYLRAACKRFELMIDIEQLIAQVDASGNGLIDYDEFATLWRMGQSAHSAAAAAAGANNTSSSGSGSAPASMTDEQGQTNRAFWEEAVKNAHQAPLDDDLLAQALKETMQRRMSSAAAHNNKDGGNSDTSSNKGDGPRMSFPEAAKAVTVSVMLGGQLDDDVDEMPHKQQLANYLKHGNTNGLTEQEIKEAQARAVAALEEKQLQRRKSTIGGNSMRPGAQTSNMMASMRMNKMQQAAALNNNNNNNNSNASNANAFGVSSGALLGAGAGESQNNIIMMSRSGMGGPLSGHAAGSATNDADSLGPDSTPAEVLKAANEFLMRAREEFKSEKQEKEMRERLNTMASARPPVIGGIHISEKRGEGIELPEPSIVGATKRNNNNNSHDGLRGGSPVSARAARAAAALGKTAMVTPRNEATLTTARSTSMKRGWRA